MENLQAIKICGLAEIVMKPNNFKKTYFSLVAPLMKVLLICQANLESVV